jgi:hypothetical protein
VIRQLGVVAAILSGGSIAYLAGEPWAAPVTIGAGIALMFLALLGLSLRQQERDRALDMVVDGHENVAVTAVQRQRSRLMSINTRKHLADAFEEMVELSSHVHKIPMRGARPLYHPTTVARVETELLEIAYLLKNDEAVSVRGVARAERVISDGMSPLYDWDHRQLRDELKRVLVLLKN